MTLEIHRPYAGVALVVTKRGSTLLGAPADAFKATKSYCEHHKIPFPRVLVAPPQMLVDAVPQFNPEFFLYDFLFVYGAAFKPELANERLQTVLEKSQVEAVKKALRSTLTGPTREEMQEYKTRKGVSTVDRATIDYLAKLSEYMAIKKDNQARTVDDMIDTVLFDKRGRVRVMDGELELLRTENGFVVRSEGQEKVVDLTITGQVIPFALLPPPELLPTPLTFGVKALGTRSGFDLSGPTTGFVFWVNGRAIVYDGPVGTRYLLEHQGISFNDVDTIILSHCHEDHMGAFVELILAGHRPKVLTSEPIYRSALVKLSSYFSRREDEVAQFVDYQRITPGEPIDVLGATFEFFYTVHAIPTLGVRASMKHGGITHRIQISGDTMHHDGLAKMREAGVLTEQKYLEMRDLVPSTKVEHTLFLSDVGEAIIHGHPKDWYGNPNQIVYYHCPDNEHTRGFGHHVAVPGETHALVKPASLHPAIPARLLRALKFLDFTDAGWFAAILHHGRTRRVDTGTVLFKHGDESANSRTFSVIVAGTAQVSDINGDPLTTLKPGEFFGLVELLDANGKHTASVQAVTPMELFDIDARILDDYVHRNGLEEALQRIWAQRPLVENIKIFRQLDLSSRNEIARIAVEERFGAGDVIITPSKGGDDFFLLVEGRVSIEIKGNQVAEIGAEQDDNFFGELAAVYPNRVRNATVRATTSARTLRMHGSQIRELFHNHMAIRYSLEVAIRART